MKVLIGFITITFFLIFSTNVFSQKIVSVEYVKTGHCNTFDKKWSWSDPQKAIGFTIEIAKDYVRINSKTKNNFGKFVETFTVIKTEIIDELPDKTNTEIVLRDSKGRKLLMGLCDYKKVDNMDEIVIIVDDSAIKYFVVL